MPTIEKRLERLELQAPAANPGRYITVEMFADDKRLPAWEREHRLAAAEIAAGTHGKVIVIDCLTLPEYETWPQRIDNEQEENTPS